MKTEVQGKLPFDLKKSDLDYPRGYSESNRVVHTIELYNVSGIGWVVATLGIGSGRMRSNHGYAARTYAVDAHGKIWRVGRGPHVLQTLTAYISKKRSKDLSQLIDLYTKGAVEANVIRDRISSRRAQGAMHRANGLSSWRW